MAIQSIERAVDILESIANAGGAARLADIATVTGLKTTTAHNILKTLDELGYVRRRRDDMRYYLGDRILNLARVAGDDSDLRRRLRPILERMAAQTGETVFLAVPSGDEVFFLDAIESLHPLKASSQQGQRAPMLGSAIGLLFLTFIPALRRRMSLAHAEQVGANIDEQIEAISQNGHALDVGSYLPGLNCVAVPWIEDGELRAGFGLSGPAERLPPDSVDRLADTMKAEVRRSMEAAS